MMPPTTDEILTQLRALLPALHTSFGVQRLGVYGVHTYPGTHSQSIDLLAECAEPLGLEFGVLQQTLADNLGWPVLLKSVNMIPLHGRERILDSVQYA